MHKSLHPCVVSTGKRQARTPTNVWFGVANVISVGSRRIKCKKKAQREKEEGERRKKRKRKYGGLGGGWVKPKEYVPWASSTTSCIYCTARTFVASLEGVVAMVVLRFISHGGFSVSLGDSHFVFKWIETLAIVCSSLASKVASKVRAVLFMHTAMLTRCYGLTSSPLSTACPFPSLLFPLPSFSFHSRALLKWIYFINLQAK